MEDIHNNPLSREDKILSELKQLKTLFAVLLGSDELPAKERFSRESITKAAKEFKKMQAARGEWVQNYEMDKIIKHAPYAPVKLFIEEFRKALGIPLDD